MPIRANATEYYGVIVFLFPCNTIPGETVPDILLPYEVFLIAQYSPVKIYRLLANARAVLF